MGFAGLCASSPTDAACPHADPFADATGDEKNDSPALVEYVHIRVQQRNGKKSLTTVQVSSSAGERTWGHPCRCFSCTSLAPHACTRTGAVSGWPRRWRAHITSLPTSRHVAQGLKKSYDYKKVLKALKKGTQHGLGLPWLVPGLRWDGNATTPLSRLSCARRVLLQRHRRG